MPSADNRLWVQRARPQPPRPPKTTSLKAKRAQRALNKSRPPPKRSHKKKTPVADEIVPPEPERQEPVSGPRKRTQVQFYGNLTPTVAALKRGGPPTSSPRSERATRSSARNQPDTPSKPPSRPPPLPRGTRVSRRLRNVDDEWQQIPDEWLDSTGSRSKANAKATKGTASDEESDLSDLTDEEEHQAQLAATQSGQDGPETKKEDSPLSEAPEEEEPIQDLPDNVDAGDDEDDKDYKPDPEDEHDDASEAGNNASPLPEPTEQEGKKESVDGASPEPAQDEEANGQPEDSPAQLDDVQLAVKEAAELPDGFIEWEAVSVMTGVIAVSESN